jgi:hypothetical protein
LLAEAKGYLPLSTTLPLGEGALVTENLSLITDKGNFDGDHIIGLAHAVLVLPLSSGLYPSVNIDKNRDMDGDGGSG